MGGTLTKKGKDQIRLSKQTGGTELNLSDCNIQKIGSFKLIVKLKLLRKLDLSRNFIKVIPSSVKGLVNLEELNVCQNELIELPSELCTLGNLRVLLLEGNSLTEFPASFNFALLSSLKVLNIGGNRMTRLPEDFASLRLHTLKISHNGLAAVPNPVYSMSTLRELYLDSNADIQISEQITHLVSLEVLDLCKCGLSTLPKCIGRLSSLTALHIDLNRLPNLPDEIGQLSRLRILRAENNIFTQLNSLSFKSFPDIEEVYLAHNVLTHLPKGFGHCTRLRVLDITDNQLEVLPKEIGWLGPSMRKLLASNNRLTAVPGELSFLNPAIELDLRSNPFKSPFIQWYQEGIMCLMENLKPYIRGYPPHCYVEGEALAIGMAGKPAQFILYCIDKQGDRRINGGDEFDAIWKGVNAKGDPVEQKGIVKDNKDGTYTVFYNFTMSGKFEVHIGESDTPIKGSPFASYIRPGPSSTEKCLLRGDSLDNGKVGSTVAFSIVAMDRFGNQLDRGEENFQVRITGPSGASPKAVIEDTGRGLYNITWTAGWEGVYTVHVTLDGEPLENSPLTVTMTA